MGERKLLICDLDGTLLDSKGEIDQKSLFEIREFIKRGNDFCICTGRMDEDIKYIEKILGIKGKYRISQNGCLIMNNNNDVVYQAKINKEIIPKLNNIVFSTDLRLEISDIKNRHFPAPRKPEEVAEFIDTSIVEPNLEQYSMENMDKLTIYLMFGNKKQFQIIQTEVSNQMKSEVNIVQTSRTSLEIFSKEASKGNAVKKILLMDKYLKQNLYIAGDAQNDISMFGLTDNTYAVGNAEEVIREKAKYYVENVGEIVREL